MLKGMANIPTFYNYDLLGLKEAFGRGENITQLLRAQSQVNTSEAIELVYDLQAGSYVDAVKKDDRFFIEFGKEAAGYIDTHLQDGDVLLDAGTGEMTVLGFILESLKTSWAKAYAFDISWSRIYKGREYAQQRWAELFKRVELFVGDIKTVPLPDKSVDITITNHALESNGGALDDLLEQLMRVTRRKLVLFEPCYELNSPEGQQRMDRLGYIKGVEQTVERLGGKLLERKKFNNIINPLNPTTCFVIEPAPSQSNPTVPSFSLPGTSHLLNEKVDEFLFNKRVGVSFPVLRGIPLLKPSNAILASALLG